MPFELIGLRYSHSYPTLVVLNWQDAQASLTLALADVGFASASATDLLSSTNLGTITASYTTSVPAHGILALKLSDTTPASAPTFTYYDAASSSSILTGAAAVHTVNSSVSVVGFIGDNAGTLTITGVDGGSSGGSKLVSVDYINADWTMTNTACSNCRIAYFSVNGGTPVAVQMPLSGMVRAAASVHWSGADVYRHGTSCFRATCLS